MTLQQTLEEKLSRLAQKRFVILFANYDTAWLALFSLLDGEILSTPVIRANAAAMVALLNRKTTFCDVKLDGNIDERQIEKNLSKELSILISHNFAGKPVEYTKIAALKEKYDLIHINALDDGLGAKYNSLDAASLADISVVSFSNRPTPAAAVLTDDEDLAASLKLFVKGGVEKKAYWNYDIPHIGIENTLDEHVIQAWEHDLDTLEARIQKRKKIKAVYDESFKNARLFLTQKQEPHIQSADTFYPIILNPELQCPKEDIFNELQKKGVDVQVHYKPVYQLGFYKERFGEVNLQVANDFYRSELSLPLQNISTEDARKYAAQFLETTEQYRYRGCSF